MRVCTHESALCVVPGVSVSGGEGVIRQVALLPLWHPVEFLLRHSRLAEDWSHVTSCHATAVVTQRDTGDTVTCHHMLDRMYVAVWDTVFRTSVTLY